MTDTTVGSGAATVELPGLHPPPRHRPGADRGDTVIAPVAVGRIAARAACEVPGVAPVSRSGLDRLRASAGRRPPGRVQAQVDGTRAVLDLTIAVRYPEPLRQRSDQVRRHVAARVQQLTGLDVEEVRVTVEELVTDRRGAGQARDR